MFSANSSQVSEDRLYVEDVFSTYLYTGTGSTQTITNGIDLAGNGGLVWVKSRSAAEGHFLVNSSSPGKRLETNTTGAEGSQSLLTLNSSGFNLLLGNSAVNGSGITYASWTFREAPKFFDVVTYTGNSTNRTIAHNLGVAPGCILIKRTDTTSDWQVYHRSNANTQYMVLNTTAAVATGTTRWNSTTPTSSVFTVGTDTSVNASGGTYVAYLFAHDTTSDGIIQCGSFTAGASTGTASVTLGWEPQWLLIKGSNSTAVSDSGGFWSIMDNMRGMNSASDALQLQAQSSGVEGTNSQQIRINPTGFTAGNMAGGSEFIYIAIRRGPMRTPTTGTSVFEPVAYTADNTDNRLINTGIVTDLAIARVRSTSTGAFYVADRLRGSNSLATALTNGENADPDSFMTPTVGYGNAFSAMNGFGVGNDITRQLNYTTVAAQIAYAFKRAPGFMDVVCYTGTGSATTVAHNLGVAPELILVKVRDTTSSWHVYNAAIGSGNALALNANVASFSSADSWNNTAPTSTVFTVNTEGSVNGSGSRYVAYLFASCPGVSKVGSYTGNGSSQTINCGFSGGARFVMIKRTDSTGDWYVWDTARGIVSANDPHLSLNTTAAEVTTDDTIDTDSSGFVVNQVAATNVNVSSATYIYLAIA